MMVRIESHPTGPRLYIRNARIHHGRIGVISTTLGLGLTITGALTIIGIVLITAGIAFMTHDIRDWPWPMEDPFMPWNCEIQRHVIATDDVLCICLVCEEHAVNADDVGYFVLRDRELRDPRSIATHGGDW